MKKQTVILLAFAAIVAGCSKEEPARPTTKAPAPHSAMPALAQEKAAVAPPQSAPNASGAVVPVVAVEAPAATADANAPKRLSDQEVTMLNYAVFKYKEQFGHFPKTLQDMIGTPHLARVPVTPPNQKLVYDPATGIVKVSNQ